MVKGNKNAPCLSTEGDKHHRGTTSTFRLLTENGLKEFGKTSFAKPLRNNGRTRHTPTRQMPLEGLFREVFTSVISPSFTKARVLCADAQPATSSRHHSIHIKLR